MKNRNDVTNRFILNEKLITIKWIGQPYARIRSLTTQLYTLFLMRKQQQQAKPFQKIGRVHQIQCTTASVSVADVDVDADAPCISILILLKRSRRKARIYAIN